MSHAVNLQYKESVDQDKVDQAVEALCAHGCAKVHDFIQSLENGISLYETHQLSPLEQSLVLKTLVDVMATYQQCRQKI